MLVGSLLDEREGLPIHVQAYADDVVMLVVDQNMETVCRNTQRPVNLVGKG